MAAARSTPLHKRKSFQVLIGLTVTLVCLWLAFDMIVGDAEDPWAALRRIGNAFRQAHWWTLLLIWALLFLFYWLKAVRWRMLLAPVGSYHPMRELFPPILVGFAFNNILPAHLGEFVRVYVFSREQSVAKSTVLASVALERIFDAGAILTFLVVGLLFVPGMDPAIRGFAWSGSVAAGAGVLVVVLYLLLTRPFLIFVERCLERVPFIPLTIRAKVVGVLEAGAGGLAAIRDWRLLLLILLNSLVQWGVNGLIIWISLLSFDIDVSPLVAAILMGVLAFGVAVPSSPGYFGVIQFLFVLVLQAFVADSYRVGAASIYYHMSQYVPVTLLGLYFFSRSGLRVVDVQHEAEEEEEELESLAEAAVTDGAVVPDDNPNTVRNCHPCWPTVFASSRPGMQRPAGWKPMRSGEIPCSATGDCCQFPACWSR